MSLDLFSYIEVGRIERKTHNGFMNEFILEMMLTGIPVDQQQAEMERHFQTVAGLLPVFELSGIASIEPRHPVGNQIHLVSTWRSHKQSKEVIGGSDGR